ncbi:MULTISPECIES: hypothetical protein [Carnobacterium]|uniref:hypothetical protein n=1 Tax=Carnobacterium TaxID=2747 RepID=UPI000D4E5470|nr:MULTISPECIES: hypothetical protein [Carnobacterium]MCO6017946.1 hypothetical protein [Carnobacterium divergens]MDT1938697.1 hypothetical protein [Carnobacterium divergens]MDT1941135.1 hypothetical protein [Carnobacterium divergens]MDT1946933.1 hypothetical protein [Carnobacterium divergens]MDT1949370.1 hypothetical protein [Carnobacterium divergens]
MLHDNEIISYEVNLTDKIIKMTTKTESGEQVVVIFSEVFAYFFEDQLFGSVILDLFEAPLDDFIEGNMEILNKGKENSWPMSYKKIDELSDKLKLENFSYFILSPSYGLGGWVVAKNLSIQK